MAGLSEEDRKRIADKLKERNAIRPCPRCGEKNFTVIDGYVNHILSKSITQNLIVGGPVLPVAIVACTHCGYLSEHALGVLELLPKNENSK